MCSDTVSSIDDIWPPCLHYQDFLARKVSMMTIIKCFDFITRSNQWGGRFPCAKNALYQSEKSFQFLSYHVGFSGFFLRFAGKSERKLFQVSCSLDSWNFPYLFTYPIIFDEKTQTWLQQNLLLLVKKNRNRSFGISCLVWWIFRIISCITNPNRNDHFTALWSCSSI